MSWTPGLVLAVLLGTSWSVSCMDLHQQRESHQALLAQVRTQPEAHFRDWMVRHAKPYIDNVAEKAHRFKVWLENLEYALEYNAKGHSHWLGMTSLADLTHEEYKKHLGFDAVAHKRLLATKRASNAARPFRYADIDESSLPTSIDWRARKAVTEVKNQAQCGSCWAFSAIGAIEGANAIFSNQLVSLSEQELVDCDQAEDRGCNGGLMDNAFEFVIKNKGIDTEDDYPYLGHEDECSAKRKKRHVVTIDSFEDVPENSESALKKAVAHQPVSVAIEADQKAFQLYMGGVFSDESCGTSLDHGVLAVGYGVDPKGGAYYIVKNSWGPDWGEKGYIRLKAGVSSKEGLCGIAMSASYPVKTSANPPTPPKPGPDPPKPPKPTPVACDDISSCPAHTTCCCVTDLMGMCLQWGCCPIEKATCCEDRQHCCPPDLPVCDTQGGRCLPKAGVTAGAQPWLTKLPATRDWHIIHSWFIKGGSRGAKCSRQQTAAA